MYIVSVIIKLIIIKINSPQCSCHYYSNVNYIIYTIDSWSMAEMLWQCIYEIFIYIIYTGHIIIEYSQCDYQSQLYFLKEN